MGQKNGYKVDTKCTNLDKTPNKKYVFATLKEEVRFGKCGYCGAVISVRGIHSHDRKCEECGRIIYKDYCRGDIVSFKFINEGFSVFDGTVSLRVAKVDTKNNYFYFHKTIPHYRRNSITALEKKDMQGKIDAAVKRGEIEYVKIRDSTEYIRIFHQFNDMCIGDSPINIYETKGFSKKPHRNHGGGFQNCDVVRIWEDKEYNEHDFFSDDKLPVAEHYHLYRDWLVEKNIHEICRRAGMTSSPEYYSGRGVNRGDLNEDHLIKIHNLIKRFHGDDQAAQFVEMVKDVDDMSATSFLMQLHNFFNGGLKHTPIKGHAREEMNDGIKVGSEIGALCTVMSVLSRSSMGDMLQEVIDETGTKINMQDYVTGCNNSSIKSSFLAKI